MPGLQTGVCLGAIAATTGFAGTAAAWTPAMMLARSRVRVENCIVGDCGMIGGILND